MWFIHKLCCFCVFLMVNTQDYAKDDDFPNKKVNEQNLSTSILVLLEHFKQPDPVGLPIADIPDPYTMPDMKHSVGFVMMYFKNTAVYGISKFHILYINAAIAQMEVQAILSIDAIQARGNCTMSYWLDESHSPFIIDITNLKILARATLGVQKDGKLQVQNVTIDLELSSITTDFGDLGLIGGTFQSIINTGGPFVFNSIKPYILKEAHTKAEAAINSKLSNFTDNLQFPNSITPLDMVIINARQKVRDMHLDPYHVEDYNTTVNLITITLSNIYVSGISSFQRVGNITFKIKNNTVIIKFDIGTQKLEGSTHWDISAVGGFVSKDGTALFSIEYLKTTFILVQPLDTRKQPDFKDLYLDVGNIQIRCNGFGTIDYVLELAVNILPNLLRYQIINAIEGPLKDRVQEELAKLNVEDLIKEELPKLDELEGFKLSDLRPKTEMSKEDEDDFFNF